MLSANIINSIRREKVQGPRGLDNLSTTDVCTNRVLEVAVPAKNGKSDNFQRYTVKQTMNMMI